MPRFHALVAPGLLAWFDADPGRYWALAWIAWGALALLAVLKLGSEWHPSAGLWRRLPRGLLHPGIFLLAAAIALLACRWPVVVAGPLRNPDETQMGAAAMTYWQDPVPWRSVDLHTAGPVNAYFLLPALLPDGRISYPGLRLAALLAHALGALAVYGLLRRLSTDGIARLGTLPLLAFLSFNAVWEYVQYSSEQPSFCLLAVAAWLFAEATQDDLTGPARLRRLVAAGLCLGCLPFAKLQSVVLGLTLGGIGLLSLTRLTTVPRAGRWRAALTLMGAAAAPALVLAVWVTLYGQWAQAYMAYFKANLIYVDLQVEDSWQLLRTFYTRFVVENFAFKPFFDGTVGLAAAGLVLGGWSRSTLRPALIAAWVMVAVGCWTVVFPGHVFWHYLHFLVLPLAWLGGLSLAAALRWFGQVLPPSGSAAARWLLVAAVLGLIVTPLAQPSHANDEVLGHLVEGQAHSVHPVSARLQALAQPGETLVVWGWSPQIYTESGLAQGTREGHTQFLIAPGPLNRFYRDRLLWDLRKRQPAFFVDAIAEGAFIYDQPQLFGHQIFPELAAYVAAHYHEVANLQGYRIYVRNQRAPRRRRFRSRPGAAGHPKKSLVPPFSAPIQWALA